MKWILNSIYLLLIAVISPWILVRILIQKKNRRGLSQKLFGYVPQRTNHHPCIWIHAVSVGEINLLSGFVDELSHQVDPIDLVISTTTETGYDLATQKYSDHTVFFCPTDFSWAVENALTRLKPTCLVLTELEVWPNLISLASRRSIPVVLLNGRISKKSFQGYRLLGILFRRIWKRISLFLVQTSEYRNRLINLGVSESKIIVTGNIKFDNAAVGPEPSRTERLKRLANLTEDQFVFVAGSTQENEDVICIEAYQRLRETHHNLRLILVPRHPERVHRLYSIIRAKGLEMEIRSELEPKNAATDSILVIDVIGELINWWQLADVGFVGGSMGRRGGQSMIEPAAAGVPTCFGPNTQNFKGAVDLLLSREAAKVVRDANDIYEFVNQMKVEPETASMIGQLAQNVVSRQLGATDRSVQSIKKTLKLHSKKLVNNSDAA